MVSIYFSLTGSISLLSAFIVSLLPTRWPHSWLLCTIFPFLSFLLWFYDICPQGRSESLSPFMQGNGAAPSRTKIANLNGVLTPNTAKYHTRGIYPIQDDRNKIKQFYDYFPASAIWITLIASFLTSFPSRNSNARYPIWSYSTNFSNNVLTVTGFLPTIQ